MLSPVSVAPPRAGDGIRILALARAFAETSELTLASPTPGEILASELPGIVSHWPITLARRTTPAMALRAGIPGTTYDSARFSYRFDFPAGHLPYFDAAYVHLPQGWSLWERSGLHAAVRVVAVDVQNDEQDMWAQRAKSEDSWFVRLACTRFAARSETRTKRMVRQAKLFVVVSDRDRDTLRARYGAELAPKLRVVPNGVDSAFFQRPPNATRKRRCVLFAGSLDTRMNQLAIRELIGIWPTVVGRLPGAQLVIAGRNPPGWLMRTSCLGVQVVASPPDIRPYMWSAEAFVAPFEAGGGTKIKILEAMATGLPVISSAAGVQGLPVTAGRHFLQIAQLPDLADAIASLDEDRVRQRIGAGGVAVARRFDWLGIGLAATKFVQEAVAQAN